ncbi:hypothetical protein [Desulfuromonas sp. AOP6]|uniref:hypothetical protein n=1 Tax=Desulfuromonas sp. AOP6 TaxID=1566351 RepID=UPI0012835E96|nr:hypothetical protein [Desulfuromonas sp. AOP6]BCA80496.1 hypothetical protein AOP6_2283 [Desulfuromonas sp. AOP6]
MKKIALLCCIAFALTSLTGCAQRLTDFTIISSKNIDLSQGADLTRGERVVGEDTVPIVIVPIGIPNAKEAMDNAIEKHDGCVGLLDGVLESEYFSFIFGYVKYRVKGTCLMDPKLVAQK